MAKLDKIISYAFLRDEVDISQNVQDEKLDHPIKRAQETLSMLMGDVFYSDFLSNFNANTLSAAYTTLLPYVKKFLAWQAYEFYTYKANINSTRSGFRVHTEDNSVVAPDIQMAQIIKDAKYQSELYRGRLIQFLDDNYLDYPLYDSENCNCKRKGNSFHMTAVKKRDTTYKDINRRFDGYY